MESLARLLDQEGVRRDAYSLVGERPQDESLCVEVIDAAWHVYYAERGLRSGERTFESEDEACEYMADHLLAFESLRRPDQTRDHTE